MNQTVIIYALCDPNTNSVRYVGKTFRHEKRVMEHVREARRGTIQTPKVRWLRRLLPAKPSVIVLEECSSDDWEDAERQWIAVMRQQGARLTNLCEGGETSAFEGRQQTEESKAKMRAAALADGRRPPSRTGIPSWNKGKSASAETRQRLKESHVGQVSWNKGKPWSEEAKAKLSAAHIGKPSGNKGKTWTPEMRARHSERTLARNRAKTAEGVA